MAEKVLFSVLKDGYAVERYLHITTDKSSIFNTDWLPTKNCSLIILHTRFIFPIVNGRKGDLL